ncbi:MAG: hypothetical protein K9W42_07885 [Candidatus Heimdallarchaeota archaeon]|nr:hypothetical protein [Candidatus Heimdallarchaeota archaeon]
MTQNKLQTAFDMIKSYVEQLERQLQEKDQQLKESQKQFETLAAEKNDAAEKLAKMEKDMAELSSVYEELQKKQESRIDFQEVFRLYIILTEQVLDGSAHIKILSLLHGAKEYLTKDELAKASGIRPAATLRAIFDLRNNGLVEYDDETERVKLVRRLFE